jgi:hypothetical protein
MEDQTLNTDISFSGIATMETIKPGTLIEKPLNIQNTQLRMGLSSKLSQRCQATRLCSGVSTLEENSTDLELDSIHQKTTSNGGSLIPELKLLDHLPRRISFWQTKKDKNSDSMLL